MTQLRVSLLMLGIVAAGPLWATGCGERVLAKLSHSFYEDNPTYEDPRPLPWSEALPSDVGLEGQRLEGAAEALARLPQSLSFLVVKDGKLVFERYFHGSNASHSNNVHSASKSILSSLVGIALRDGIFRSKEQLLSELLPAYTFKGSKRDLRLKHLLTMTAGLRWTEDETEYELEESRHWVKAILALPQESGVGKSFKYSTGLTHLLSAALTDSSGESLRRFAERVLFNPLGITVEHWGRDPQGYYSGGYNLYLTPRELARLGQLVLQGGEWEGRELVPREYLAQATAPSVSVDSGRSYGYLWWLPKGLGERVWKMWGYGGQFVYVLPDRDTVVVVTADTKDEHKEMNGDTFLREHLL